MKSIKVYVAVVLVLLGCALILGIYVWTLVQKYERSITAEFSNSEEESAVSVKEVQISDEYNSRVEARGNDSQKASQDRNTIDLEELTESQRNTLQVFDITGSTTVITDVMVTCMREAVGDVRTREIVEGSAPSPMEASQLTSCMKQ